VHGDSGSGKTRLLRLIADLDAGDGEAWLDGLPRREIPAPDWRRRVMYLAADSQWWYPRVGAHATDWAPEVLDALGFDAAVLDWSVDRLSSGERQRLALARALSRHPDVLLLDEPTANLDQSNTARVERLVGGWRADTGGAVVWVSHDPDQRARVAELSLRMESGRLLPGASND
jgi:ABC-type iron transport system FetAB ATPase subunit